MNAHLSVHQNKLHKSMIETLKKHHGLNPPFITKYPVHKPTQCNLRNDREL